jgi:hypothetical protein
MNAKIWSDSLPEPEYRVGHAPEVLQHSPAPVNSLDHPSHMGYMENVIAVKEVQVERKHLSIEFRENERGRFLRITETAHGHRNAVIIPSTGLADFTSALAAVLNMANKATQAPSPTAA